MLEFAAILHAVSTIAMLGVIWFVQLVHYPLFAHVGSDGFTAYELQHRRRTTWVVAPLMAAEAITSVILLIAVADGWPRTIAAVGAALVAVNWLSTAFVQVPLHAKLSVAYEPAVTDRLVRSNWLRTAAWTLRAPIAIWLQAAVIS